VSRLSFRLKVGEALLSIAQVVTWMSHDILLALISSSFNLASALAARLNQHVFLLLSGGCCLSFAEQRSYLFHSLRR
jgi:hypothetical protein